MSAAKGTAGGRVAGGGIKDQRPWYARALRLKHISPGSVLCFIFFEGAAAVGLLLALAELIVWWMAVLLVLVVAVMVKLNDVIAGAVADSGQDVDAGHDGDAGSVADRPQEEPDFFDHSVARSGEATQPAGEPAQEAGTEPDGEPARAETELVQEPTTTTGPEARPESETTALTDTQTPEPATTSVGVEEAEPVTGSQADEAGNPKAASGEGAKTPDDRDQAEPREGDKPPQI